MINIIGIDQGVKIVTHMFRFIGLNPYICRSHRDMTLIDISSIYPQNSEDIVILS